jgi:hypothetical protein
MQGGTGGAHRVDQDLLQIGAVDIDVGRAVLRPRVRAIEFQQGAAMLPVRYALAAGLTTCSGDSLPHFQVIEPAHGIRCQRDTRTDLLQGSGRFVEVDPETGAL